MRTNVYVNSWRSLRTTTPQTPSRAATQTKNNASILLFVFVVTRTVVVNLTVLMTPLQNSRHRRYAYLSGAL